jgi:hypothetical protein
MCRRCAHATWQTFRMSLEVDCRPRYTDRGLARLHGLAGGDGLTNLGSATGSIRGLGTHCRGRSGLRAPPSARYQASDSIH